MTKLCSTTSYNLHLIQIKFTLELTQQTQRKVYLRARVSIVILNVIILINNYNVSNVTFITHLNLEEQLNWPELGWNKKIIPNYWIWIKKVLDFIILIETDCDILEFLFQQIYLTVLSHVVALASENCKDAPVTTFTTFILYWKRNEKQ